MPGKRKYPVNEDFFKVWSTDMAYILGLITADGYVGEKGIELSLQEKDAYVVEYVRDCLSPTRPIYTKTIFLSKTQKTYYQKRLIINSKEITKDLEKLGVVRRKTGKETLPNIPNDFLGDYIRGVFDGDGHVYSDKTHPINCSICSASKVFLESLQSITNLGRVNKSNNIWNWSISSYQCGDFCRLLYSNGGFSLERKKIPIISFKISSLKCVKVNNEELNTIKTGYENGLSINEIANLIKRKPYLVIRHASKMGLQRQKRQKWTDEEKLYVKNNFDKLNPKQSSILLANEIGKTLSSLQHFITRNNLCGLRNKKGK